MFTITRDTIYQVGDTHHTFSDAVDQARCLAWKWVQDLSILWLDDRGRLNMFEVRWPTCAPDDYTEAEYDAMYRAGEIAER